MYILHVYDFVIFLNNLQKIGSEWTVHLEQLEQLKKWAKDPVFQRNVVKVKQENKLRLAQTLEKEYGVRVNPASIFDIQVRIQILRHVFNILCKSVK